MTDVVLHVYCGAGPLVGSHSAIQVYGDDEWSFGYCEQGTGVYSCPSTKDPMYTYREKFVLGQTNQSILEVDHILRELRPEWPGLFYELDKINSHHFCQEFCKKLGVPKPPVPIAINPPPRLPIPPEIEALFPLIVIRKKYNDILEVDILTLSEGTQYNVNPEERIDIDSSDCLLPGLHLVDVDGGKLRMIGDVHPDDHITCEYEYTFYQKLLLQASASHLKRMDKNHIIAGRTTMALPKTSKVAILKFSDHSDIHEAVIDTVGIPGCSFLVAYKGVGKFIMVGDMHPHDICDKLSSKAKIVCMKNIEDYIEDREK